VTSERRKPTRVLVLGGSGMLGHKLWQVLDAHTEAFATLRDDTPAGPVAAVLDAGKTIGGVCADDVASVERALQASDASVVVNCIGVVKQDERAGDPLAAIRVNSLFPHELAAVCAGRGARLIHVSTDCVFSGRRGGYNEEDVPDPPDLYGRSKLLGEVAAHRCLTLRTSMIGRELGGAQGLLEWFLSQQGTTVGGFRRAVFTGLTTLALSELVAELIEGYPDLDGLWHVSAAPIDKLALLELTREAFGVDIEIEPRDEPVIDRSLDSSRFRARTGWAPRSWPDMLRQAAQDSTPYGRVGAR
jgi:dTDP-4-dehydrorhamnose reductase